MKVAIGPGDVGGCGNYRLMYPFRALANSGDIELSVVDRFSDPAIARADLLVAQRCDSEDSVEFLEALVSDDPKTALRSMLMGWLSRRRHGEIPKRILAAMFKQLRQEYAVMAEILEERGVRPLIALEVDDNLKSIPPLSNYYKTFGNGRHKTRCFQRAARSASFLILSTEELRSVYASDNARAAVCPNALEDKTFESYVARFPSTYCETPKRIGKVRIGYVGSMSHVGDVSTIVKPLQRVMDERSQVHVVFYGQDLRGLFAKQYWPRMSFDGFTAAKQTENQSPSIYGDSLMPRYYEAIANLDLDIALAPLERHIFNRSKSNVKVLEYSMAGAPTVATRYGPYAAYGEECPSGIVTVPPDDDRAWVRSLIDLVDDGAKRKALVDASRAHIAKNYVMSAVLPRWRAGVLGYAHAIRQGVAA